MNWTPDQKKVIEARNCNLLVSAAAGSGKTAVLVERIIEMLSDRENPIDIDELLVVTFTKAAAAQMKDKIARAIEKMLEQEPENEHYLDQMNLINKANILTIDSFCYQIVKENFHILGIDPGIRIGDAGEIGLLREEILEEVIEEFYEKNSDFVDFSDAFSADKDDGRVEEYILKIYDISSSYPQPAIWTKHAADALHVETEADFVKLPFVKQYMKELHDTVSGIREKVLHLLEQARGLDGPAYMEKALLSDIVLFDDMMAAGTYSQFHDLAERKYANIGRGKKGTYDEDLADFIKEQRDAYKKQINALLEMFKLPFETVLLQVQKEKPMLTALLDITNAFRERFLQAKVDKGILEFSDVEHFALQVLCKEYGEDGEPVPSDIGREMAEDFREILIDEYQDSNYLQEAILKCVSRISQGNNNIFMVGDVKQSIYSFRMARPDLFIEKYRTYEMGEGFSSRKILLKNNFRSRANILESINYIFYQIMGDDLGGIAYTEEEALVPGNDFLPVSNDSVELLLGESKDFEFLSLRDEEMSAEKEENLDENLEDIGKMELEASIAASRIEKLLGRDGSVPFQVVDGETGELRDARYKDIVILFRAPRSFQQIFFEVLMNHNIPVKVQNENGYFDTVEISLIFSLLRIIDNPQNDIEFTAVLRSFFGKFPNDELALLALVKRELEKGEKREKKEDSEKEKTGKKRRYSVVDVVQYLAKVYENIHGENNETLAAVGNDFTSAMKQKNDAFEGETDDSFFMDRIVMENLADYKDIIMDGICPKCHDIIVLLDRLREKKSYVTVAQLLVDIYYGTGYYYYVEAMPEGKQRVKNLDLLLQETRQFENGSFRGLFHFLSFIDKIQKKSIVLGGDPAPESSDDCVRIMSIHKSKGLEFPIVFVSGIGKNFNLMDTKTPLIIHSDYYIGAKYIDTKKRCGNDTFSRKALAYLMITESIAEELRILYVALTRAKEKLILTGVTSDIPALVKKYEDIAKNYKGAENGAAAGKRGEKLTYRVVRTARNYLDMITAALIRNRVFCDAMKSVRKRMDKKSEHILSAEYDLPVALMEPDIDLKVQVYDFKSLAVQHIQSNLDKQIDKISALETLKNAPSHSIEKIERNLTWKYQYEMFTKQKSKLSVTEIKRIYETDYEPSDVLHREKRTQGDYTAPIPCFLAGEKTMDAAEKGTWMHKTMELLDQADVENRNQVREALVRMREEGRIPEETKTFITEDKIFAMVDSAIGKRMRQAARNGLLYKEKQFVVGVPAQRLLGETVAKQSGTQIVVQGIIDAYFREGDNLILVDYKTDRMKEGQEEQLRERYKTQLLYYKDTLEQLTGLTVSETYLYSFALDKEIPVL